MSAVEAFRQISYLLVKWILGTIFAIIALVALIFTGAYAYQWYSHDRHVDALEIGISTDSKVCTDPKFPLFIYTVNRSRKTIAKVTVSLSAYYKGRSTNLAQFHSYGDDHIIEPKEGYGNCWAVPSLSEAVANPLNLQWAIQSKYVDFK